MKSYKKVIGLIGGICLWGLVITSNSLATTAIVNTDTLKLRKEASTDSTVLELLNQNQQIEVIKQEGDWYQVKYDGITGYVHKDYIQIKEEAKVENTQQTNTQEVTSNQIPASQQVANSVPETDNQETQKQLLQDVDVKILPLLQASSMEKAKKDTKITVISQTNGWYYVATQNGYGWVRKEMVGTVQGANTDTPQDKQAGETPITPKTMYVNESSIYVRKGPSTQNEILTSLIRNTEVTVIGEVEDWYKVQVNKDTGYIAKRLLSDKKQENTTRGNVERNEVLEEEPEELPVVQTTAETTQTNQRQEVVNFAKQYLGCKYVYGASGPSTFDCSGFTMYVYRQFGISLSHSAIAQSKKGTAVAKENLQPGDLVFFKDYETMDGIGHCGIYIGNGEFIHASSGTGYCVKISTLLSGSYEKRYDTARSVL